MGNLIKRAFLFLETGEFDKADEYFEKILDEDCENGQAYLGKLMVERRVNKPEALAASAVPLENSVNYQMIMRFGDEKLKKQVSEYNQNIKAVMDNMRRETAYNRARAFMAQGTVEGYEDAGKIFLNLGDYKDAKPLAEACKGNADALRERYRAEAIAQAEKEAQMRSEASGKKGKKLAIIISSAVAALLIVAIVCVFGLGSCGKTAEVEENVEVEGNIESVAFIDVEGAKEYSKLLSAGSSHTVGLLPDGTVVAVGENEYGECDVSEWNDIVAVSASGWHTVGLKSDGTVVAVGWNRYGECDVSAWRDIVAVSSGTDHTVGLKSDGTVVAVGRNSHGQCDVLSWHDIIQVSVGYAYTVGLKSDGTVVAVGSKMGGLYNVSEWNDIVAVSARMFDTVGLKSDGTVVAVSYNEHGQCDVSDWRDIVAVSAGYYHTVGLKSDGTVVAVGMNHDGRCDVSGWRDIVAVAADGGHTVGLKSDGTVVAVGNNDEGQCDVSGWDLID